MPSPWSHRPETGVAAGVSGVVAGATRLPRTEEVKGTGQSGVDGAAAIFLALRMRLADDESRGAACRPATAADVLGNNSLV
jgi:hypothetical protein